MASIKFYNGRSYGPSADLSSDIITSSVTAGLHGSLGGHVKIEVTSANIAFLNSLEENSHFVKFAIDGYSTYGAIVDGAFINKNICTVNLIGFYEYLDKMEMFASHKANFVDDLTTIIESDSSFTKIFYSDSAIGLLYILLKNLRDTLNDRGFSSFFNMDGLIAYISANTTENWGKSYRLNSLELPTVKSVIDDVFGDAEIDMIGVTVSKSGDFKWNLNVIDSYESVIIDESVDMVKNVEFEEGDDISRAFSFASGTNLRDEEVISKQNFSSTAAYSSYIANNPSDRTSAIDRINRNARVDADKKSTQISFTTFNSSINLLDAIKISGDNLSEKIAVVTELNIEGSQVTYKGQVVSSVATIVKGVKKPTDTLRKILYEPLNYSRNTSKKNAFKKNDSTGWRS